MACRYRTGDNCNKDNRPCIFSEKCYESEPITNADRIRAMGDEELAWELMTWRIETAAQYHGVESDYPNTQSGILKWLKQPAEKQKEDA